MQSVQQLIQTKFLEIILKQWYGVWTKKQELGNALTSGATRSFNQGGKTSWSLGGQLANIQKKVEKWRCIRMWISALKLEITGKHSKKLPKTAKKQPPT